VLPEPWYSIGLVVAGAALGAWGFGAWCGCLCRLRWRRKWRDLAERQGRDFCEGGHTARFIAAQIEARNAERARDLARRAGTEAAR